METSPPLYIKDAFKNILKRYDKLSKINSPFFRFKSIKNHSTGLCCAARECYVANSISIKHLKHFHELLYKDFPKIDSFDSFIWPLDREGHKERRKWLVNKIRNFKEGSGYLEF